VYHAALKVATSATAVLALLLAVMQRELDAIQAELPEGTTIGRR